MFEIEKKRIFRYSLNIIKRTIVKTEEKE